MTEISVNAVQKKFLSCAPISKIDFPEKFNWDEQKCFFEATVGDSLVQKYPLKAEYQQKFIRKLIEKLEDRNEEVYEEFYERLCQLLSEKGENQSNIHYRHYIMDNAQPNTRLIIQESKSLISEGTTGLCSWQAALALAEWCALYKNELKDKKILELGSGVGLTGLTVLSLCSPKKYTFSDCHPSVLNFLRANVDLNSSNIKHSWDIRSLPWENVNDDVQQELSPNLVIAADVIYDNALFPPLIKTLKIFLSTTNCVGIIAMTVRNEETISEFLKQLRQEGLNYVEIPTPEFSVFIKIDETPVKIIKLCSNG